MFLKFPKKSMLLKFLFQREKLSWSKIYGKTLIMYVILVYFNILTVFLKIKLYDIEIEMTKLS